MGVALGGEGCWSSGGGAMGQTCFLHLTFAPVLARGPLTRGGVTLCCLQGRRRLLLPGGPELVLRLCSSNPCRGTLRAAMGVGEGQLPASLLRPLDPRLQAPLSKCFCEFY